MTTDPTSHAAGPAGPISDAADPAGRWLAALEGYYGPPYDPATRVELVGWLGARGYHAYVCSPKDDAHLRARWREPHPDAERAAFEELAGACADAGVALGLVMSPGLDWRVGDPSEVDRLTARLEDLLAVGVGAIGVAWDDVPGEGATVGADHGAAVATVVRRLGADTARWSSCPVDYAVTEPTPYLRAFAEAMGEGVELVWTGPSVVTTHLTGDHVRALRAELGRPLVFAENFPVNDLGMAGALHLGPYPRRDPAAMDAVDGLLVNVMALPHASRLGLALAARHWQSPGTDRELAWREAVAEVPGLEPLARACRSWLDDPGPDPDLARWADAADPDDRRLRGFLEAGCRDGLEERLAAEVEPWLERWEQEAGVQLAALDLLDRRAAGTPVGFEALSVLAMRWVAAQRADPQVFGTRFAVYPDATRAGGRFEAGPDAVVWGENLTDRLCRRAIGLDGATGAAGVGTVPPA